MHEHNAKEEKLIYDQSQQTQREKNILKTHYDCRVLYLQIKICTT